VLYLYLRSVGRAAAGRGGSVVMRTSASVVDPSSSKSGETKRDGTKSDGTLLASHSDKDEQTPARHCERARRCIHLAGQLALNAPTRFAKRILPASFSRQLATVLKIFISYLQMLAVFGQMQSVHWPQSFIDFIRRLDITEIIGINAWISKLLLPYDCVYHQLNAYAWLVLTLALPLACSLVVIGLASTYVALSPCERKPLDALQQRWDALRPALWNLHIWFLLLLYPSISRDTLSIFRCIQLGDVSYLGVDTTLHCDSPEWYFWAFVAAGGVAVYSIGLPALSYYLTRRHHRMHAERRTAFGRQISLLIGSYVDSCYWYESADLIRKFLLTGVVLNVWPGSRLQLWFGLMVSVAASIITVRMDPYQDAVCGRLQIAATLQIMFNYISAILFFVPRGAPQTLDIDTYQVVGPILLSANCVAFFLLVIALGAGTRAALLAPLARWESNQRPVVAKSPKGSYHCFISHHWARGQDQAKTLKTMLSSLVPSLRCFLDVDDLYSIDELECYVDRADALLVFLTGSSDGCGVEHSEYFGSTNCLREFRQAVKCSKPMVVVEESDAQHGHVDWEVHRMACPADLREALDRCPRVTWYRLDAFQKVSLRLILSTVLRRPGCCNGSVADDAIYVHREVVRSRLQLAEVSISSRSPPRTGKHSSGMLVALGAARSSASFHLYVSTSNPGALDVARMLTNEATSHDAHLSVTSNPHERTQAARFLLYLNAHTYTSDHVDSLQEELEEALEAGHRPLLVWEQRAGHGALPFDLFLRRFDGARTTPHRLLVLGLYKELAVPLYGGDHLQTSLRLILRREGVRKPPASTPLPSGGLVRSFGGRRNQALKGGLPGGKDPPGNSLQAPPGRDTDGGALLSSRAKEKQASRCEVSLSEPL